VLAFAVTAVVIFEPSLFWPVLFLDLWFLGYHHVIATYTRTAMDRQAFRRHWHLNVILPFVVLLAVILVGYAGGAVALSTIYIHWLLCHYVRQSEGISTGFGSKQPDRTLPNRTPIRLAFYLLPLAAFLTMSSNSTGKFLNFPVFLFKLPPGVLIALWAVT